MVRAGLGHKVGFGPGLRVEFGLVHKVGFGV